MTTTSIHIPTTAPATSTPRLPALAAALVFVALVAAWAFLLRPQALGGEIAYIIVSGRSMDPVLDDGDMALVRRESSYSAGDVIVYRVPAGNVGAGALVIHRVVGGSAEAGYVTRGDNREDDDFWRPQDDDVVGKVRWHVPGAGGALAFLHSPLGLAAFAGLVAFALALPSARRRR